MMTVNMGILSVTSFRWAASRHWLERVRYRNATPGLHSIHVMLVAALYRTGAATVRGALSDAQPGRQVA